MADTLKYLEQFERVKRWYHRFEEINNGRIDDRSSDFSYDEILSYFMNCYHLKDWIQQDESAPKHIKEKIKKLIDDNLCFRYCADIVNGAKHLKLDRHRHVPQDIKKGPRHLSIEITTGKKDAIIKEKYSFLIGNDKIDAFELATECLQKWEGFIYSMNRISHED